jgi:hypothetical protein
MIRFQDLSEEKPLTLPAAAIFLGNITGQKPHVATIWRWCLKGCHGVKLESICIGGKRFVTRSAIERFVEDSTNRQTPTTTTVTITPQAAPHVMRHNERRKAEIEAARRKLDELTGVNVNRSRGAGPETANQSA